MWRTEALVALRGRVKPRAGCQQQDTTLPACAVEIV